MSKHAPPELDQCVVVLNPASTNYKRALTYVKHLKKMFPDDQMTIIEVTQPDYTKGHELIERLADKLGPKTLLCIAAGDGTISLIINLLLTNPDIPQTAKHSVILPLWGGNANDLAYMVNGPVVRANIDNIIKKGKIAAIHPLEVTITHDKERQTRLAVCYISVGASAYATNILNQPAHRSKRIYRLPGSRMVVEASSLMRAMVAAKPFESEIDGKSEELYDLILANGPRIAKVYRTPAKLTDSRFHELHLKHKQPAIVAYAPKILRATAGRQARNTERELTAHQATWIQFDGEVEKISPHSRISIKPYDQACYVLSTKL